MKRYLYAALAAALTVSCQSKIEEMPAPAEENAALEQVSFVAGMPATKTAIEGLKSTWVAGDKVAVYSVKDDSEYTKTADEYPFEFIAQESGASTTLTGEIVRNARDEYQAFYPKGEDDYFHVNVKSGKVSSKTYFHTLPGDQSGTGEEEMISAVGSEAGGFEFKHESSMFKFEVPEALDMQLSKIEISNRASGNIWGKVQINAYTNNVGTASDPAGTSISMSKEEGIPAGTYYLVSLPLQLASGINVVTYDLEGQKYNSRKIEKSIDLRCAEARTAGVSYGGVIANLGTISSDPDPDPDPVAYDYPEETPAFAPILAVMKYKTTTAAVNATNSGNVVTFSTLENYSTAGQSIKFSNMTFGKFALTTDEENCFTVSNIKAGSTITYVIPVPEGTTVSGDVEFTFNINSATPSKATGDNPWSVEWSTDEANWSYVDALYDSDRTTAAAAAGHQFRVANKVCVTGLKVAEFSLPAPVSSGNNIYVRLTSSAANATATQTTRINYGFCLAPKTTNTAFPEDVLLSQNFSTAVQGANVVSGRFMSLFTYMQWVDGGYNAASAMVPGYTFEGHCTTFRGLVNFGWYNNDSETKAITLPALTALESSSDVIVSFKIAPFVNRKDAGSCDKPVILVTVAEGNGTAGDIFYDKDLQTDKYNWHVGCCRIKGADASTVIRIGSPTAAKDDRFYLDDIVVVKEQ